VTSLCRTTFFVIGLLFFVSSYAIDVTLTQDFDSIVLQKKIDLRFSLDPCEQGVLKSSLQFSIDSPFVMLSSWQSIEKPSVIYAPTFKKTHKMFTDSFSGVLFFDCRDLSINERKNLLREAAVYVVGLVIKKDGKTKPFALAKSLQQIPQEVVRDDQVVEIVSTQRGQSTENSLFTITPVPDLEQEYAPIDKLSHSWDCLKTWIYCLLSWQVIVFVLSIFVLLLILLVARRRIAYLSSLEILNIYWERELTFFTVFVLLSFLLYAARYAIGILSALCIFALLCFIGMLHARLVPPFQESFLGRLKDLIGLILGALVVPVLFKAYLLYCGL
jgi:hypothetical protein